MLGRSLVVVGIVAASGCMTFRPLERVDQVGRGSALRLTFEQPRNFSAVSDTATYQLLGIVRLGGQLESVRSDTLMLRNVDVRSGIRQPRLPRNASVSVVPGTSAQLAARRFNAERTLILALVAGLSLGLAIDFNDSFWGS